MGLSLSWIFAVFTGFSIAQTFLVTSVAFAGLSLWGYTTKRDISGWGSFLIMGVIGLIVASLVNIWLGSPAIMFAPLLFVFGLSAGVNRMSDGAAQIAFYAFAAVMGLSLSSIFLVFTGMSIVQVFLITAIAFAGLSIYGYTTKRDISGMGSFLIMGVIGLIVASIVNIWLQSPAMMFAVSVLGVLIFAGLTAYDTQKIKTTYLQMVGTEGEAFLGKAAILGALSLYLDFINMFMFLLQLFGNRE
jgi:FtsH-binding integral membrane protein